MTKTQPKLRKQLIKLLNFDHINCECGHGAFERLQLDRLIKLFEKKMKRIIGEKEELPPNIKDTIGYGENEVKMNYPDYFGREKTRGRNQLKEEQLKRLKEEVG